MNKHQNIFLVGPMGSGKTSVGRRLSKALSFHFYDSDSELEKRTGATVTWIFDVEGEAGFRLREKKIIEELAQKTGIVLATGGGAILDLDTRKVLSERGLVIYLKASLERQCRRTERHIKKRPLLKNGDPKEILKKLQEDREKFYSEVSDTVVTTDGKTTHDICKHIIQYFHESSHT
ncbi:MAG: shikimate kinase AroK [Gammaproteobacteria bacterium]|nr:shikimate kinase AroK [Gammaproteobacteria bacterium]